MKSPSRFVNASRQKDSLTENGAVTNSTTLSNTVDLFFLAGACRQMDDATVSAAIQRAFNEDKELATRVILWAGDIRGGAGERRFFKLGLRFLHLNAPAIYNSVMYKVPDLNRWDSLFEFAKYHGPTMDFIAHELIDNRDALLAKWMPREGKSLNQDFRLAFMSNTKLTPRNYRQLLANTSRTVEQQMSRKEFGDINYSHVPSQAMNRYRTAFHKQDGERFTQYIEKVTSGEEKINAGAIFPYQLYEAWSLERCIDAGIDAQWNWLPDYLKDSEKQILPVCDVSGSMMCANGLPMAISVSLGVYLAERNRSIFKDAFVTFSEAPQMHYLQGATATAKFAELSRAEWGMNTNLNAVFSGLLRTAVENNLPPSDLPETLLVISDMEFDRCAARQTNFDAIKQMYENSDYKMPDLVFWNVAARSDKNFPVRYNQQGVALVSGASPSIVKAILSGEELTPEAVMKRAIMNKRYDF